MKCSSVCCMPAIESYVTLVSFFFGGVVAVLFRFCSPCQAAPSQSAGMKKLQQLKEILVEEGRETRQVWDLLLDGRAVEAGAKRPAGALVTETPAKVKAPRWTVTP